MRYLLGIAVVFILSLGELLWPEGLRFAGVKPELLLIAVIFFALKGEVFFAGLAGFIKDAFSPAVLGTNFFLFLLFALLISRERGRFNQENLFLPPVLTAVAAVLVNLLTYLCLKYSLLYSPGFFGALFRIVLPASFFTALLSPFLFALLRRLRI